MKTFFWYDFETWGSDAKRDRAAQFAGVRTDLNLNIIGEPLELYCKPPLDLLPHPEACLIHGITPQIAQERGVLEYQFAAKIHAEFSKPETCVVGFNNIKFDDEVTRLIFYRNFYDPYEREWNNGNSRWDVLKLVRVCYALRPEGIKWPINEEGNVSLKLENLARENGIPHDAHNAMSDVFATLNLARLIKEKQPKLFDYFLKLRNKNEVLKYLDLKNKKSVLNISGMFSVDRYCAALMMPLAKHPTINNEIICYDLSIDPSLFSELDVEEIQKRTFSTNETLKELNLERGPFKSIRINQCPMVCDESILNDDLIAQRLRIDRAFCKASYEKILLIMENLVDKINSIYQRPQKEENDPEKLLYRNFPPDADKNLMHQIRALNGCELAKRQFHFLDDRFSELLLRYRARNFPETLTSNEYEKWMKFCYQRLTDSDFGASIVLDDYKKELLRIETEKSQDERSKNILIQLSEYINSLLV
jgi:exodeoxyribonuclease-1